MGVVNQAAATLLTLAFAVLVDLFLVARGALRLARFGTLIIRRFGCPLAGTEGILEYCWPASH